MTRRFDKGQLQRLLRGAVLSAMPLAAMTMACGDPCMGPETRKDTQSSISKKLDASVAVPLSFEDCAKQCQNLIQQEKAQLGGGTLENFKATKCETKKDANDEGMIDCDASYTLVSQSYTGAPGCPVPGRMPAGLSVHKNADCNELGRYFAQMASMEEAAVTAFRYMVEELEAYNAPEEMLALARQAIDEEVEHAALARMLAEAYGGQPWQIEVEPFALRPLAEIALENAAEGCVNETFASACAMWQSEHAKEAAVREVMARIAYEESRHAELSWALDAWLMPQLSTEDQRRCQQAKADAVAQLEHSFSIGAPPAVRQEVGLPEPHQAAALFSQLRQTLWT